MTYRVLSLLAGLTFAGIVACADGTGEPDPVGVGTITGDAKPVASCQAASDLSSNVRDLYDNPQRQEESERVRTLQSACDAGDAATTTSTAWAAIGALEAYLVGHDVDPAIASTFVNSLLACTASLCDPAANPALALQGAFGEGGIFALRGADQVPALARDWVAFTDWKGNGNYAFWGVEVDVQWSVVQSGATVNPVLVYGAPKNLADGVPTSEDPLQDLGFDLEVYPDAGAFADGMLHVGVCFAGSGVPVPHQIPGDENSPELPLLMQRQGVLLQPYSPTFCASAPPAPVAAQASLVGSFFEVAVNLLPRAVRTAFFFENREVPSLGSTPLDFSFFQTIAANPAGYLEWASEPGPVQVEGQPLGAAVRALSGDGTPAEKVVIELYIAGNQGTPAGAVITGDPEATTQEPDGVATFSTAAVDKPGGYTVCARVLDATDLTPPDGDAEIAAFTFSEVCTTFNARNAND